MSDTSQIDKKLIEQSVRQVKQKLKGESKNELLRIITALLVDNYVMKAYIETLEQTQETENA